jgi:hypothetical protein
MSPYIALAVPVIAISIGAIAIWKERRRNGEDPTPHKETERSSDGR